MEVVGRSDRHRDEIVMQGKDVLHNGANILFSIIGGIKSITSRATLQTTVKDRGRDGGGSSSH